MGRPVDWTPLADSDPVPGDPAEVARLARRYADTAAEVTRQAANLRTLASAEGWDSDAGRTFAEAAGGLAADLEKTRHRYAEVAGALRDWSPRLDDVQARADQALAEAKAAQAEIDANQATAPEGPPPPNAPPPSPAEITAEKRRHRAIHPRREPHRDPRHRLRCRDLRGPYVAGVDWQRFLGRCRHRRGGPRHLRRRQSHDEGGQGCAPGCPSRGLAGQRACGGIQR